jgi:hypothetical protein
MLDGSGSVSFDVLSWLAEQDVSLVRIDWRGEVVCVASRSGYAANPYRVQWQRETRADENLRMEFSFSKITQKIENSISTLEKVVRRNEAWNKAMEIAFSTLTKLDERQPKTISQLRALEANAAAAYFRAWKGMPIKWRGISKRPVVSRRHRPRLSHLAPEIVGALLAGRHPIELTPTRLLRLSKNLPHDWKEQRRFLGFSIKIQPKRSTSDDSTTALRDPAAVRAPHQTSGVSGYRRCLRRVANAREF